MEIEALGDGMLVFTRVSNAWLTGAGSRRLEGTNIGHENAEGMAYVGVHVERPVRLRREGTVLHFTCQPTLRTDTKADENTPTSKPCEIHAGR